MRTPSHRLKTSDLHYYAANAKLAGWVIDETHVTGENYEVFFLDNNHGWVAGSDGLWKTTDSGDHWTCVHARADTWGNYVYNVKSLCFVDNNNGWMTYWYDYDNNILDADYSLLETNDGGATWHKHIIASWQSGGYPLDISLYCAYAPPGTPISTVYLCKRTTWWPPASGDSGIFKTTDHFQTITEITGYAGQEANGDEFAPAHMWSKGDVWLATSNFTYYFISKDNGATWSFKRTTYDSAHRFPGFGGRHNSIGTDGTVYGSANKNNCLYATSNDGGTSWYDYSAPDESNSDIEDYLNCMWTTKAHTVMAPVNRTDWSLDDTPCYGILYYTEDDAATWQTLHTFNSGSWVNDLWMCNENLGFAVGGDGLIARIRYVS